MSKMRIDKFYILTGKGPGRDPLPGTHTYPWTMEDQAKLIEKALAETPLISAEVAA